MRQSIPVDQVKFAEDSHKLYLVHSNTLSLEYFFSVLLKT